MDLDLALGESLNLGGITVDGAAGGVTVEVEVEVDRLRKKESQ